MNLNEFKDCLAKIRENKENRAAQVQNFQNKIWNDEFDNMPENEKEILRTLAYDLDYYEPAQELRSEDPSYYGDERLVLEIEKVLSLL
ncbi:hypothetical protein [Turneriella parva]|uniref:Colicin D immunity protein domain-containing protein n=1 Tax=Turneriella parva (strain ATCC BAA-1111 / DSM 21527 / NCTC 11395 / H) TaxID=869212 RepID=I4B835_TURPD|nr:hypothetical protein [Turneriella parva]AFM13442.1 hypothetical protein Turpa_2803 [Turneriella parva DSM 21527]